MHSTAPRHHLAATDRVSDRLPIFTALATLGFKDAEIGRLLGVSTMSVNRWARGMKPVPLVRQLALQYVVTRLLGIVGAQHPVESRYARRAAIAREAATRWVQLARDEMDDDQGGVLRAEDVERGIALGERIIARLTAQ